MYVFWDGASSLTKEWVSLSMQVLHLLHCSFSTSISALSRHPCHCCWPLSYIVDADCTENTKSSVAAETCLLYRCVAMTTFTSSTIPAFSHHVTLLPPEGCSSQTAYRHIAISYLLGCVPVIAFTNGTSTSCWPRCFCFWFQRHISFIPRGLGLVLLFSSCSVLKAARPQRHGPFKGMHPSIFFYDRQSPVFVTDTSLEGWIGVVL
jgi:hypothetical protein